MSDPVSFLGNASVNIGSIVGWGTAIVTTASVIVAATPTPNPSTFWGKVYGVIEVAAVVVGKAKDLGYAAPMTPTQAGLVKAAQDVVQAHAAAPKTTEANSSNER